MLVIAFRKYMKSRDPQTLREGPTEWKSERRNHWGRYLLIEVLELLTHLTESKLKAVGHNF